MNELSPEQKEALLSQYSAELTAKKAPKKGGGTVTSDGITKKDEGSVGLEGISVNGVNLGGRKGREIQNDVPLHGVRSEAVSSVPRELVDVTRGNRPVSPERSADELQHDDKGWYRIDRRTGEKVYE